MRSTTQYVVDIQKQFMNTARMLKMQGCGHAEIVAHLARFTHDFLMQDDDEDGLTSF